MATASFTEALSHFSRSGVAIIRDDGTVDGRAVVVTAAATVTTELTNTLISRTYALPFVAVSETRADTFRLAPMARPRTNAPRQTQREPALAMCISVEARSGVSTGISAADRATTIRQLGAAEIVPRAIVHPGHIFPVVARSGGVLVRSALPEAALDLVTLNGGTDAALYFDLLSPGGSFATIAEQQTLAATEQWPILMLSEIVRHRLEHEQVVYRAAEARLPTSIAGELRSFLYRSAVHEGEHVALVKGEISATEPILTRVHQGDTFCDVFGGGGRGSSRQRLLACLAEIGRHGRGVLVYLQKQAQPLRRPESEAEFPTHSPTQPTAVMREYGLGAQILRDLGVRKLDLMTGSTKNLAGITTFGLEIVSQRPLPDIEA